MKRTTLILGTLLLGGSIFLGFTTLSYGGFGEWEEEREYGEDSPLAVQNARYREECGACHFAYPPQLLPAASWTRIMNGLGDHFGDIAILGEKTRAELLAYLRAHAADRSGAWTARRFRRGAETDDAPLRITETPFFRHEHDEIPPRLVQGEKVRSFANCAACHREAERGYFDEHSVYIPGHGRWDD